MQPTQPEPSSEVAPDAAAPVEEVSSPRQNFFTRLFSGRRSEDQETEPTQEPATSPTLTLTQEDLDKRVQAETDRREAKRRAEAEAAERRRLRDEDPWAYAELDRNQEQAQRVDANVMAQLGDLGATHDRYTLDPLVETLPQSERDRILKLEGAGIGLDGRKLIVQEGLKALEKHWKAEGAKEAESRLRRNPAFRKQVLGEFRRGSVEPEFMDTGTPSAADRTVSNILRQQIQARH